MAMLRTIEQYTPADYQVLGITQENFEELSGPGIFKREQIGRIMRTMNCILFSSLEVQGIPKIVLPSEFVAAHIVACVSPGNRMLMCIYMAQERQTGVGAMDQVQRVNLNSQYDQTSAEQLFALCCMLSDTEEANFARQRYMQKMGLRIEEALLNGGLN